MFTNSICVLELWEWRGSLAKAKRLYEISEVGGIYSISTSYIKGQLNSSASTSDHIVQSKPTSAAIKNVCSESALPHPQQEKYSFPRVYKLGHSAVYKQFPSREMDPVNEEPISRLGNCLPNTD